MNDKRLENLIEQVAQAELPDCPNAVEGNVLRRIRVFSAEPEPSAWDWLFRMLPQPRFMVATFAMVALVSSGISIFSAQSIAAKRESHSLAATALDFYVFNETEILNLNER